MLRMRAVVIGLLAVAALGIITPVCDLHWIGVMPGASYMPVGSIFLFFFFVFVLNTLLKALKIPLSPQELLLIYAMMAVSSGIPSFGYVLYAIGIMASPFYYANPTNRYVEVLHKLIPDWMAPKNPDTIRYLYEGLPKGMAIPYKDWITPLFWWTLLVLAMYLVMFCLAVIVRKQWVENEKLIFPLALVPVDMVKEGEPEAGGAGQSLIPSFFKNKLMWLGFLIPVLIYSIRGLHFYFPSIPTFKNDYYINFTDKPWNSITIWIKLSTSIMGFAYLIPTSLSFSIWFFYWVNRLQVVAGAAMGFQMPIVRGWFTRSFLAYQQLGGMIAFAVLLFWAMRRELADTLKKMFRKGAPSEDKKEGASYLLAFAGLIGGFLFICFWAMAAGAPFWAVFLWAAILFLTVVVITRIVSESGLFFVQYDMFPLEAVVSMTGSQVIGAQGISTLNAFNHIFPAEGRVLLMPFFLNNIKMAESSGIKRKSLYISMWLAIILMVVVSYVVVLNMAYRYGAVNFGQTWWLSGYPKQYNWDTAMSYITTPVKASLKDVVFMGIGAAVTGFLYWMGRVFIWWPFHPIGYLIAGGELSGTACRLWFMTMMGWLAKVLIVKLGGIKIYRMLMPVFLGLIIGEFVTVGAWVIVDLFTGAKGNFLMWL